MRIALLLTGLLSLGAGILIVGSIKSDIQLQIMASCLIGAMLMFGQVVILSGQKAILRKLNQQP